MPRANFNRENGLMNSRTVNVLGLGPVFAYEWITASRRWQAYALRSLFLSLLFCALLIVWLRPAPAQYVNSIRGLAYLGELFFQAVIGTQLALVLLAAPAATAGAICLDRARGTLAHMLVTDLTDREIVLGKLAARLVPVLGLVACALPMMELLAFLGGVDPEALFGAFVVTLGVGVLGCSLALVFSLWAGKTHEALLGTYAVWGLWLLGRPMLAELGRISGWALPLPTRSADPFWLAFAPYMAPATVTWVEFAWFFAVTAALSALLIGIAVVRLRPGFMRDATHPEPSRLVDLRVLRRVDPRWLLPAPALDGNPVIWREWHRTRPSRWAQAIVGLYAILACVFSAGIFIFADRSVAAWVNALQVSVGLLMVSVTAATSLAEERVRGSLDVLMTTPLSTRQIVLGKWLGTVRLVPALAVLPTLVVVGLVGLTRVNIFALALVPVYVMCAGAAATSLGLAMATLVSRLGRALALTVTLFLLVTVGWFFGPGGRSQYLSMGSPFFWAGAMTWEMGQPGAGLARFLGWGMFWTLAAACTAISLVVATLGRFDRCVGRVEDNATAFMRGPRVKWTRSLWAAFYSFAVIVTLGSMLLPPESGLMLLGGAFQVTIGLILLSVTAAIAYDADRRSGGLELLTTEGRSPASIVLMQFVRTFRPALPIALLASAGVLSHEDAGMSRWLSLFLFFAYILALGAAFVSLGLCVTSRTRSCALAVGLTILLGLALVSGFSLFAVFGPTDSVFRGVAIASPLIGVGLASMELASGPIQGQPVSEWVAVWTPTYAVIAVILLEATCAIIGWPVRRGSNWVSQYRTSGGSLGEQQTILNDARRVPFWADEA
jgi:ABC-type transport system involved in multi-copper enzyme maturation permease subunit